CGLDMRQNSAVHEASIAELVAVAAVRADYAALDEHERVSLLARELSSPRPLRRPTPAAVGASAKLSDVTASELAVLDAAADAVHRHGAPIVPHSIISKTESVSDVLEAAVLLKEAGLVAGGSQPASTIDIVPLFETIEDLQRAPAILDALLDIAPYRALVRA